MAARPPEQVEAFCRSAKAHWQKNRSRHTQVREVLCRVIATQERPFSAEELYESARKIERVISRASVYRTLANLVGAGLLSEMQGSRDERCYTLSDTPGAGVSNIVCMDCNQVVPLSDECLPLREGFLAKQMGFKPQKMRLRIEASCEELRRSGECRRRKSAP